MIAHPRGVLADELCAGLRMSLGTTRYAHRSDPAFHGELPSAARSCQHCHGAPGIVTTFADAPFTSPELEELLIGGGKLT
jgi:hypothetical protein